MLETLIADDDFPEDDFSGSADPNAETVFAESPADLGEEAQEKTFIPEPVANRLLMRYGQGSYEMTKNRISPLFR
jgi:hypothetical protein